MRLLIRTTILFSTLLTAITVGAVLIGREQPISDELALLRLSDCAPPCWLGITPGITTLREAKARIAATFDSTTYVIHYKTTPPELIDFLLYKRANPAFGVEVLMATHGVSSNRPIAAISLYFINFHDFQIPLGEIVNALGNPTYFRMRNSLPNPFYGAALAYNNPRNPSNLANQHSDGVLVGITCDRRIQYAKPTGWLDFTADPPSSSTATTLVLKSWRGFADFSRYDVPAQTRCTP